MRARLSALLAILGLTLLSAATAHAQKLATDEILSGVVAVKTFINPDGRTVEYLGREREGSGVVIDDQGLIVTIGYLMVEAHAAQVTTNDGRTVPANVVGYDQVSGFGLLQAISPLKVRPMALGKSADVRKGDPVIVASSGGAASAQPARVIARREFAGSWEYLLDNAIFTAPPHMAWSGAALINRDGKLVGVGSLILGDAGGKGQPGNMFVPIDTLTPILADLLAQGRPAAPPPPWLGLNTEEQDGRLVITQVSPEGPAEKAGLERGDIIVGVGGVAIKSLPEFYRKVWARGAAGTTIPLDVAQDRGKRRVDVKSMNRLDHLRLKSTF
ncbi:MAG: serine protease [Xanthobacteraceae bacterium]|nr:serine protease [Xanthobacteraceae bacterium]